MKAVTKKNNLASRKKRTHKEDNQASPSESKTQKYMTYRVMCI